MFVLEVALWFCPTLVSNLIFKFTFTSWCILFHTYTTKDAGDVKALLTAEGNRKWKDE